MIIMEKNQNRSNQRVKQSQRKKLNIFQAIK